MPQAITNIVTDWLMQGIPDGGDQLASVKAAAGDATLWVGTILAGAPLRRAVEGPVHTLYIASGLAAVALALMCLALFKGVRSNATGRLFLLFGGGFLSVSLLFGLNAYDSLGRIRDRATTAVAITPSRILLFDSDGRADIPATALTRVTRLNGEQAVTLRFQAFQSLRIEPGSEMFGLLGAVNRLAEEAGSKAPLRRGTLG